MLTLPSCLSLHRRTALLGAVGLLVLPAAPLRAAAPPQAWPRTLVVPGGVAQLPLGPGTVRPVAHLRQGEHDVPLLVVGDAQEWTALVGIALATAPGPAQITVRAADGSTRTVAFCSRAWLASTKPAPCVMALPLLMVKNNSPAWLDRPNANKLAPNTIDFFMRSS